MLKKLTSLLLFLLIATPALAAGTTTTYTSGILILVFIGFCSLLVVAQLLPAVMHLVASIKAAKKQQAEKIPITNYK